MALETTSPETVYATKGNIALDDGDRRPGESDATFVARIKTSAESKHAASLGSGAAVTMPTPKVH